MSEPGNFVSYQESFKSTSSTSGGFNIYGGTASNNVVLSQHMGLVSNGYRNVYIP